MYRQILCLVTLSTIALGNTNYRLNTSIKPRAYSIAILPYFDTNDDRAFTFDGEVDITFTTENVTNQIKLHSEDLDFNETSITVTDGLSNVNLVAANGLEFDKNYTFAYINLQTNLEVNIEYSLKIVYQGKIRDDLNGFYKDYYIENGVKKWYGATQFEPTHARKAFPSFDEPEYKATFTMTIDRPANYKPSRANTKLQSTVTLANGYVREIFHPTPVMSTYLVAFLVSEFDGVTAINGTKEFGVYSRPDAVNQTGYAFDFGQRVVNALGDYFGIDYYSTDANLKLDHIALPDFRAGAMENWGLVKYREALLLFVPEDSNPYYQYRVAQIIAHETTHMWFGNLVTCHWWSNTWLNEGFANYFQDYITSLIEPEVGSGNILVTGSVYTAYDSDAAPTSSAITNDNVNSPAEISGHFGGITYQKAGSVIRMMHHLIGDDAFKFGLHNYLETNKFGSGYPDKMYEALDLGVRNFNSLQAYPGTTVAEVMRSWISQPGHPTLHVEINYEDDTVLLTQNRYFSNASHSSDEIYNIPITYTTQTTADFMNTKPVFIMKNKTHQFSIANNGQVNGWVIFNIQETGFYRVNYDDYSWQIITSALKSEERTRIHYLNRAKIVNDLFAFYYADQVNFARLYDLLEFLDNEDDHSVWFAALRGLNKLWTMFQGHDELVDIQNYALKILESEITKLGYEVRATDGFETLRNRMQVLEHACMFGHQGCIDSAVAKFRALRDNGTEVSPSLRPVVYCTGLRYGTGDDYDFLWNRMYNTNVANEARVISDIMGCTTNEEKLKSYLVSMLVEDSPIKTQDLMVPLTEVLSNHSHLHIVLDELRNNYTFWTTIYLVSMLVEDSPIKTQDLMVPLTEVLSNHSHLHIVLDELRNNYTFWTTIYPSMDTVLSTVASALHTEDDFEQFESFLAACTECTAQAKTSAQIALVQAKSVAEWADNHRVEILTSLRSNSVIVTPSLLMGVIFLLGQL